MGIRFYCPQGHKLNVKEFQAGRKGICPFCGSKILIPTHSTRPASGRKQGKKEPDPEETPAEVALEGTGQAEAPPPGMGPVPEAMRGSPPVTWQTPAAPQAAAPVASPPAASPSMPAGAVSSPPPPMGLAQVPATAAQALDTAVPTAGYSHSPTAQMPLPASPAPLPSAPPGRATHPAAPDPISEAPEMIWYVRPPTGGQFGPAAGDVMRSWLAEGRVSADSLLWREGWRDWLEAGEVFPQLRADQTAAFLGAVADIAPLPVPHSHRHKSRRTAVDSQMVMVFVLLAAVLVLLGVFLYVLLKQ